jgi:ADP-ribosylglycohydrolase
MKYTDDYVDKVRGCWLGKCLGGVVGMPYEGVPCPLNIGAGNIHIQNVPNDDLELQLIWLDGLKRFGVNLDEKAFASIWLEHIPHGCDEYSVAIRNLKRGILPPASGWKDNFFVDGMGATIRSEIWALMFPGRPDAAGYFAMQDAQVDHWGDGVRGEMFMAAAESVACVDSDVPGALRFALEQQEKGTRLHKTLTRLFTMYDAGKDEKEVRNFMLLNYQRHPNFTDCVMNLAVVVYALLWGQGDFIRTILLAVNFGRDTDCTGASCGAFLGIAHGAGIIPPEWRLAVREELALNDYVTAVSGVPLTFTALVEQTVNVHNRVFSELDPQYPPYRPYVPAGNLPSGDTSRWLILEDCDNPEQIAAELLLNEKLPAELSGNIVAFDGLNLNLSRFAHNAGTIDMFTFVHMDNREVAPEDIVLSVTADVGLTLWIDGRRIMNHHSRQKMLPSFHRAEGGAAFAFPLQYGDRKLIRVRLYYCLPPLQACIMFGNIYNDHLENIKFTIGGGQFLKPSIDKDMVIVV